MPVGLGCHDSFLEPFFAIFGRRDKALADGNDHIIDVQITLINHAVHCHLGEAIEA